MKSLAKKGTVPFLVVCAGCATTTIIPETSGTRYVMRAPRTMRTSTLAAAILPVGSVPYDNRSLPLVSPDGTRIATQTGAAPDWPTVLGQADATVPAETRLELYAIDREQGQTRRLAEIPEPLLLGRGGDAEGFLVEAPRPDGARWIGRHPWASGTVEWLVADERVNAFASLGADGRLAWSRRAPGAEHFDLVVRRGRDEWVIGAQGGDWLLPVVAAHDGLFALRLLKGHLAVAYMETRSPETMRASLTLLPVASDRTRTDAYQALASHALMHDVAPNPTTHLLFWHPGSQRMALWRPLSSPAAAALLEPGSVAALVDPSGLVLLGTPEHLAAQDPANSGQKRVLVPGPQMPRPVDDTQWPYLLLAPHADRIDLTCFRPLAGSQRPRAVR